MEQLLNDFSPGLFIVQTVLLLGLIFLLVKFAWKPILNSLNEREEGIKNALESAKSAREEMEQLQADNDRILKEARAERDTMMKDARQMKDTIIAEAKEEASAEASKIITQAQATIQAEKQAAIADLKGQVAEISIEIAEKVVKKELANDKDQVALVEQLLKDVTLS